MDEAELHRAYAMVFASPDAVVVLADLYEKSQIGKASPIGTPSEVLQYIEGARSIYQYIDQCIYSGRTHT